MRCAALSVVVVCLATFCATAAAWSPPPTDDAARLAFFLPFAEAAWPGAPCTGSEVIHQVDMSALFGRDIAGHAGPGDCEIWIDDGLDDYDFCTTLTHELGHLDSQSHTDEPGSIMNPVAPADYEPCHSLAIPPVGWVVHQRLRSLLPAPRASWQVTCTPRRNGRQACIARSPGHQPRHFQVTVVGYGTKPFPVDVRQDRCTHCGFT